MKLRILSGLLPIVLVMILAGCQAPDSAIGTTQPPPTRTSPQATRIPLPAEIDLLLIYDDTMLTIINRTATVGQLIGLTVGNEDSSTTIETWTEEYLSVPLDAVPEGDCLHISVANGSNAVRPSECPTIRAELSIVPEKVFWIDGTFKVKQDIIPVAICQAEAGRCEVTLPDQKPE